MKKILFGVTAALATVSLATMPMTAHARDHGGNDRGNNVALGVLGGVAVGAAIASTAYPYYSGYGYPYYAAPAPSYYYAPQGYYYPSATYSDPSTYYGSYHNDGY